MAIMTVNGPIQKEKLGVTSPHEHALLDIRNQYVGAREVDRLERTRVQIKS